MLMKCERCRREVEWLVAGVCSKCVRELRSLERTTAQAFAHERDDLRNELVKLRTMIGQSFFVVLGMVDNAPCIVLFEDGDGHRVNVGKWRTRENGDWEAGPFAVLTNGVAISGKDANDTLAAMTALDLVLGDDEMPSEADIDAMTDAERNEIIKWALSCHLEASDNDDVVAGPAPDCLRRVLPHDHYLQKWRTPDVAAFCRAIRDNPGDESRTRRLETMEVQIRQLSSALTPLVSIADAYDANNLDDEARKFWGLHDEHENQTPLNEVELYCGRGGGTLLTLGDCVRAREALRRNDESSASDSRRVEERTRKTKPRRS